MYTGYYGHRHSGCCGFMGRPSTPPAPTADSLKREIAAKIKAKQEEIKLLQAQLEILSRLN